MIDRKQILNLINKCEEEFKHISNNHGVFEGDAGLALFYFEKKNIKPDDEAIKRLDFYFERCMEGLKASKSFTLSSGDLGVYFVILYFINNRYIEDRVEDYFEDFSEYGIEMAKHYYANKNFDYLHGILGILFLYAELYRSAIDDAFKLKMEQCINYILELLLSLSVKIGDNQLSWLTRSPDGTLYGHTFGLAHGLPSIMSVLTTIYKLGIQKGEIEEVLKKAL